MYDRYFNFRANGKIMTVPFISIPKKNTDYYETYKRGVTRLDVLSQQYYGDPNYGWLILQANPQYGSLEFLIPDKSEIRIPYPLMTTIDQYNNNVKLYIEIYGID